MKTLKNMLEKSAYWSGILVLGIIVGVSVKMVDAWVEPNQMPPGGNIAAPINTGNIGQSKQGGLTLNIGGATYGLIIDKGLVGIGTTAPGEKLEVNGNIKLSGDTSGNPAYKITNVAAPINSSDVATKGYVDALDTGGSSTTNTIDNSLTGNSGLYSNTIVDTTPGNPYTEVCIKNSNLLFDQHNESSSTQGGNCVPGDIGYIIEKNENPAARWTLAKVECLKKGMRLPESFEWQLACLNNDSAGLSKMIGSNEFEWTGNTALMLLGNYDGGTYAPTAGGYNNCDQGNRGGIVSYQGSPEYAYRCVR